MFLINIRIYLSCLKWCKCCCKWFWCVLKCCFCNLKIFRFPLIFCHCALSLVSGSLCNKWRSIAKFSKKLISELHWLVIIAEEPKDISSVLLDVNEWLSVYRIILVVFNAQGYIYCRIKGSQNRKQVAFVLLKNVTWERNKRKRNSCIFLFQLVYKPVITRTACRGFYRYFKQLYLWLIIQLPAVFISHDWATRKLCGWQITLMEVQDYLAERSPQS